MLEVKYDGWQYITSWCGYTAFLLPENENVNLRWFTSSQSGRGGAALMIGLVKRWAKSEGYVAITLCPEGETDELTIRLEAFYARQGFVWVGEEMVCILD
jgi:predicted GNAT superfamily acetyltransferase